MENEYERINDRNDLYMSDTGLVWWDLSENLRRYRYAKSEQGDITSNPVRIHKGDSSKDGLGIRNPRRNLVVTPLYQAKTRSSERCDARGTGDYFRVIAQCIIIWGQLSDGHRSSYPPIPTGNLIPREGGEKR